MIWFWYIFLLSMCVSLILMIIWIIKWYRNKSYSVSTRKALNAAYPAIFGLNIMLLACSYAQNEPDIVFVIFSALFFVGMCVLCLLVYTGWLEKRYIFKKGMGFTTIAPRFEVPSKKQLEEQKAFETMSDAEKQAWYEDYCKNNKLLNPIIAVSLLVIAYAAELYLYVKWCGV